MLLLPPPPRVVLLVGLPGCGKSTYARSRQWPTLSSDHLRFLLADDETDQTIHGLVFKTLRYLLRERLQLRRPLTCIDATNLTRRERRPYVRMAHRYGASVEAVYFDVPFEVCAARNAARHRVVPREAMERLAAKLRPPHVAEGFTHIHVVSR